MNRKLKIFLIAAGIFIIPVLLSPLPRFKVPLSTVVESSDGALLGARIADDGQWRFPLHEKIPEKFEKALLTFEDRYFYFHPGINPVSVVKALADNIKAGEIVRGGSTITMQVARIAGGNRPRTWPVKIREILSALKLELFRSKKRILEMYASNAPFGGNTVGIETAAWRYAGKTAYEITWAEAAALAVLPNSPALVHPGRNPGTLKMRRDMLLQKLYERNYFDSLTLSLSLDEPLPGKPRPLPAIAPHLTDHLHMTHKGKIIKTTINSEIQERATEIINSHQRELSGNSINNAACIIINVENGDVLAYAGNSFSANADDHGSDVDIIRSERSTGSILKPFLYAAMQHSGELLPDALIADVPLRFTGFSPRNFDFSYSGAVPASAALSQSLNIPAVKMLQQYTQERFLSLLQRCGFSTFDKPSDHYGLSLILGGGEASLWELSGTYASLSRVLKRFNKEKAYSLDDYHPPNIFLRESSATETIPDTDPPLSAASIWMTYQALKNVNRPAGETGWQYFSSSPDIAWKTGTSFGFRDAWAVGTTPEYVIGVWAGNADGEGRPGLTGTSAAAPILFDLVQIMHSSSWFEPPYEELSLIKVCSESGFRAGPSCPETKEIYACINGLRSNPCPYHKIIHLDPSGTKQVTADCVPQSEIRSLPWFVLPPAMEYFYRQNHPGYKPLPPVAAGCRPDKNIAVMEFIYPTPGIKIFIPRDHTGLAKGLIAETAHRNPSGNLYWHLDDQYIGTTKLMHQIEIYPEEGVHLLTVVDESGNTAQCHFTITGIGQ